MRPVPDPFPPHMYEASYNSTLQARFNNTLPNCDYRVLQDLLYTRSNSIDINMLTRRGATPSNRPAYPGSWKWSS